MHPRPTHSAPAGQSWCTRPRPATDPDPSADRPPPTRPIRRARRTRRHPGWPDSDLRTLTDRPDRGNVAFAAERAADLFNATGRRRGSLADCMIAATCLRLGVSLATANVSNFRSLEPMGLRLVQPWPPPRRKRVCAGRA